MVKRIRFFALALLPLCMFGCSIWGHKDASSQLKAPMEAKIPDSPLKFRVVDVSNDTGKVYDVDVIGLLWNGMEDSLKEKGMLWTPQCGGEPYVMRGSVVYFKEPSVAKRVLPYLGKTVLKVRVEISRGGQHVATIEESRTIGYGKGMWTLHAWREVFAAVSQEVVSKAAEKL